MTTGFAPWPCLEVVPRLDFYSTIAMISMHGVEPLSPPDARRLIREILTR